MHIKSLSHLRYFQNQNSYAQTTLISFATVLVSCRLVSVLIEIPKRDLHIRTSNTWFNILWQEPWDETVYQHIPPRLITMAALGAKNQFKVLLAVRKTLHSTQPTSLYSLLTPHASNYCTRLTDVMTLAVSSTKTLLGSPDVFGGCSKSFRFTAKFCAFRQWCK